jgi:hypothetical protein
MTEWALVLVFYAGTHAKPKQIQVWSPQDNGYAYFTSESACVEQKEKIRADLARAGAEVHGTCFEIQ